MQSSPVAIPMQDEQQRDDVSPVHAPRFRTRCFANADRWFNQTVRLFGAVHQGFWLGCLTADDLNAITAHHFDKSQFYASAEHNLSGFFGWEKPLIECYFRPGSRTLVSAAGGGREVLALRKAGFDAEGFECSQPLIDAAGKIAAQLGKASHVSYCPPDSVPAGPRVYDGLVVGWTGYTHIPTRARRILFLQALRERALPTAPVLLSFFTRSPRFLDDAVIHRTARFCRFFARAQKEPLERGDRISYARYVHAFTRDEIEAELRDAGFQLVEYGSGEDWGYAIGMSE
jgi:hypothetical protein